MIFLLAGDEKHVNALFHFLARLCWYADAFVLFGDNGTCLCTKVTFTFIGSATEYILSSQATSTSSCPFRKQAFERSWIGTNGIGAFLGDLEQKFSKAIGGVATLRCLRIGFFPVANSFPGEVCPGPAGLKGAKREEL